MAISTTSILLILYVVCESIRANSTFYAFYNYPAISASLTILFSEVLKLLVAIFFLFRHPTTSSFSASKFTTFLSALQNPREIDWKRQHRYAIPAFIYLINNLVYYTVLPLTSPTLLQVCILVKFPMMGVVQHFTLKSQRNPIAWLSLLVLCLGLGIFNFHSASKETALYLAPATGLLMACWSTLASIATESNAKEGEFWESQALLYAWGILFAIVTYPLLPPRHTAPSSISPPPTAATEGASNHGLIAVILGVVLIVAITGLVVAVLLRARDNSLKVLGMAISVVTVAITQFALLPGLGEPTFTTWKVFGGGVVAVAVWVYNYHCQERWTGKGWSFTKIPSEEDEEKLMLESDLQTDQDGVKNEGLPELHKPDVRKIVGCGVVILLASLLAAYRAEI